MCVTADVQELYNPAIRIAPDTPERLLPDEDRGASYVLLHNCGPVTPESLAPNVSTSHAPSRRAL